MFCPLIPSEIVKFFTLIFLSLSHTVSSANRPGSGVPAMTRLFGTFFFCLPYHDLFALFQAAILETCSSTVGLASWVHVPYAG